MIGWSLLDCHSRSLASPEDATTKTVRLAGVPPTKICHTAHHLWLDPGSPLELAYVSPAARGVGRTASLLCYMAEPFPLGAWGNGQGTNFPASRTIGNSLHPRTIFLMAKDSKGSHFSFKKWFFFVFFLASVHEYICMLPEMEKLQNGVTTQHISQKKSLGNSEGGYGAMLHSAKVCV